MIDFMPLRERLLYLRRRALGQHHERSKDDITDTGLLMLADAAVAISVASQHGISARALAKSVGRLPEGQVTPADLDRGEPARIPASPIGAALDLLKAFESGTGRPRETIPESH